jgi:hypothetical protein
LKGLLVQLEHQVRARLDDVRHLEPQLPDQPQDHRELFDGAFARQRDRLMPAGFRAVVPRRLAAGGPEQRQTTNVVCRDDAPEQAQREALQRARQRAVGMALVQTDERMGGRTAFVRE